MTKRKSKNHQPTGCNSQLGKTLLSREKCHGGSAQTGSTHLNVAPEDSDRVFASITHENDLEELLNNASLAGQTFEAERRDDFKIMSSETNFTCPSNLQSTALTELNRQYGHLLMVPRRPSFEKEDGHGPISPEELKAKENEMFLNWRRNLATLTEDRGVVLTPFERNLEIWRQLWRVVERSDVVVQIVDARNPLLFLNTDLRCYVKEVNAAKTNLILVNKADLLAQNQLDEWHRFFLRNNMEALFWSATGVNKGDTEELPNVESADSPPTADSTSPYGRLDAVGSISKGLHVKSAQELLECLKALGGRVTERRPIVIGMVGYPNVGKSSTINTLLGAKRTSVSATPGKTKHFQTIIIDDELTLCDSPGLVMPSFGLNTSEMLLNGILSIDEMREHYSPIQVLIDRVPRGYLESIYSLPPSDETAASGRPKAHDLLTTLAFMKGIMSASGIPDCSRVARLLLKDVVNGKVRWCAAPPDCPQSRFDSWSYEGWEQASGGHSCRTVLDQLKKRNLLEASQGRLTQQIDRNFFSTAGGEAHLRSVRPETADTAYAAGKKHWNKGKREKLRRVFAHLDA